MAAQGVCVIGHELEELGRIREVLELHLVVPLAELKQ